MALKRNDLLCANHYMKNCVNVPVYKLKFINLDV